MFLRTVAAYVGRQVGSQPVRQTNPGEAASNIAADDSMDIRTLYVNSSRCNHHHRPLPEATLASAGGVSNCRGTKVTSFVAQVMSQATTLKIMHQSRGYRRICDSGRGGDWLVYIEEKWTAVADFVVRLVGGSEW